MARAITTMPPTGRATAKSHRQTDIMAEQQKGLQSARVSQEQSKSQYHVAYSFVVCNDYYGVCVTHLKYSIIILTLNGYSASDDIILCEC